MRRAQTGGCLYQLDKMIAANRADQFSDGHLLERFTTQQDAEAFEMLVGRHGPMVLRVCRQVLRHTQDAEDAFQATFLVLARQAAAIRKPDSVASWLHGVAYRIALQAKAGAVRWRQQGQREAAIPQTEPLAEVTWRELQQGLHSELNRLPDSYRAPLVLCYLEGKTQDEAARQLGWSMGTFRRRLERGREVLHRRLAARGFTLSAVLLAAGLGEQGASTALPTKVILAVVNAAAHSTIGVEGIPARVSLLAGGVIQGLVATKIKFVPCLLLVLCLIAAGAGALAKQLYTENQAANHSITAARPAVKDPEPESPETSTLAALDRFGDPLPPGAIARLGTVRFHHGASVAAVAFSPNGQWLASASQDHTTRVWDVVTGKQLHRFQINDTISYPTAVAFTPDNKALAVSDINGPAHLFDLATDRELRQFGGPKYWPRWVAISPDGRTLAFGGNDEQGTPPGIRLADLETGKEWRRLEGHAGNVLGVAFSPDGTTLASAGADKTVRLWDLATGRELRKLLGHQQSVRAIAFSPDGRTLASASRDQTIRLWDPSTGIELQKLTYQDRREDEPVVIWSRDGKRLISGHTQSIRFWEAATGKETLHFEVPGFNVGSLALSPDGKTLASGYWNNYTVRLWDFPSGRPRFSFAGLERGPSSIVFSPDGRCLATGNSSDPIRLWETATGKELLRFNSEGRMAFSPDGKTLLGGGWNDGKIHSWDLKTGKETRGFQAHRRPIFSVAVLANGSTLVTAGGDKGEICLWDMAHRRKIGNFGGSQQSYVFKLAVSPNGNLLASLHQDGTLSLWEVASGKKLHRLVGHPDQAASLAFAPDGRTLASGGYDGTLYLWDVEQGKELNHEVLDSCRLLPSGQPAHVRPSLEAMVFSPDGRMIVTGGQHEPLIHFWEVSTKKERRRLEAHQGPITALAFSSAGTKLASVSEDGTALVWDVALSLWREKGPAGKLSPEELKANWENLAHEDAAKGFQAMCHLAQAAPQALALIREHVRPLPVIDSYRLAGLLKDLDSAQFAQREKAKRELENLGESAEPALRRVLRDRVSLEVRRRVEQLLAKLEGPEKRRRPRALEVIEQIGNAQAEQLLKELARGAPGARLTQDAKASLERLAKQSARRP